MRVGYSISESTIVPAVDVDYGDCAKMQIVCPACREAVFKGQRTSERSATHYFSHYKATSEEARACEMRVSLIASAYFRSIGVEGHGQALELFFREFRNRITEGQRPLESVDPDVLYRDAMKLSARSDWGRLGEPFEIILHDEEFGLSNCSREDLSRLIASLPAFSCNSEFWLRRQASYVRDVLSNLVAEQSRPNLIFTMACSYLIAARSRQAFVSDTDFDEETSSVKDIVKGISENRPPSYIGNLFSQASKMSRAAQDYDAGYHDGVAASRKSMRGKSLRELRREEAKLAMKVKEAVEERQKVLRRLVNLNMAGRLYGPFLGLLAAPSFVASDAHSFVA